MCPQDDLFDIKMPEDNGASESNTDFVQDDSFMESLDFIDGLLEEDIPEGELPEDDIELDAGTPIDDEIMLDVDMSGSSEEESASDVPEKEEDSFDFAKNFVANARKSDDTPAVNTDADESESSEGDDDYAEDSDYVEDEDEDYEDTDDLEDMMIVTEGTMITGSIATDRSLLVLGTVNGDISCEGKLTISGTVTGNSSATDVFINDQRTEGNITCTGSVKIGQGSVVIGDINAGAAVIAGAVKGNLDVKGPVILDSSAVIKGNIKAKSVQLINGAVLEGFCSLEEYSNSNMDEIFKP
ncbi:MAG: polymer-forming cytoskeletal protein [Lachnospiraceae bacterium]|nr:polymer-forming cytoskeletal protein [Lachnospiraceae bacterium]